jgi:hypothetical protein
MIVLNKKQNFRLCHSGVYGNRVRQWESIEEWKNSGYSEPVAMRVAMLAGGGGPKQFGVPPEQVISVARSWEKSRGIPLSEVRIAEMADGERVLQGHYLNDVYEQDGETRHGYLRYTLATGQMPIAFEKHRDVAYGHRADLLIRSLMTTASYEDWQELVAEYSGHVLEFSVWNDCLGDLPHRNAIVWEIRRY